jgi:hypothetical protein
MLSLVKIGEHRDSEDNVNKHMAVKLIHKFRDVRDNPPVFLCVLSVTYVAVTISCCVG